MANESNEILFTVSQQQAETQRFLGRMESSIEAIRNQHDHDASSFKESFDMLNKRISDTNTMICTSLQEIKTDRDHYRKVLEQHEERLSQIEKEREKTKGLIQAAKIALGLVGTAITAIIGFLINVFMRGGGQ